MHEGLDKGADSKPYFDLSSHSIGRTFVVILTHFVVCGPCTSCINCGKKETIESTSDLVKEEEKAQWLSRHPTWGAKILFQQASKDRMKKTKLADFRTNKYMHTVLFLFLEKNILGAALLKSKMKIINLKICRKVNFP